MPLTVNVGFSQKLGLPDFGSIGASCHLECELDGGLLDQDPETFQSKIRDLYAACTRAVEEELASQHTEPLSKATEPTNGSRKAARKATASGTPAAQNGASNHQASSRQIDYLQQLARQIPSVGVRKLESLAQRVCGKPIAGLSSFDASTLIDTLKAIKEGRLDVDAAPQGAG